MYILPEEDKFHFDTFENEFVYSPDLITISENAQHVMLPLVIAKHPLF